MQDAVAIAISIAAGAWLLRTLWRQVLSPSCGKTNAPPGTDGFVPLASVVDSAENKSGRPGGRPDSR